MKNNIPKFKNPKIITDKATYKMAIHDVLGEYIAGRLACKNIIEICTGAGLMTIQLAKKCGYVTTIDNNKINLEQAKHNLRITGLNKKVDFILGDALDDSLLRKFKADIVFADPDWSRLGEPKSEHAYDIHFTQPPTDILYRKIKNIITSNIAIRFAKETNINQIKNLDKCELEYIYLNDKLKFIVAYFGDLKRKNKSEVRINV